MGYTLIEKLKPNYFDISELKDEILVIKKPKCKIKKSLFNAFNFLKNIKNSSLIAEFKSKLINSLDWKESQTVLIISINSGDDLLYIPKDIDQKRLDIVALDSSFSNLVNVRDTYENRFNLSLMQCCTKILPFVDNSFDIVLFIEGINSTKDKTQSIKEIIRVAKPNAKIIIADRYHSLNELEDVDELEQEILKQVYECEVTYQEKSNFFAIKFTK